MARRGRGTVPTFTVPTSPRPPAPTLMPRTALLLLLAVAACDSSGPAPASPATFVGNTGDAGGGTVTRLDAAGAAEALAGLGGRVTGVAVSGRRLLVLVDSLGATTQGRLDVVDLDSGALVRRVAVGAPRALALVGGTAYVSNSDTYSLTPVFLATGQTGPPIPVGDTPEGVVAVGNRVFVAGWGRGAGRDVRVVSALSRVVVDVLDVGCAGPRALLVDGEDEVWAFCTGGGGGGEAVVLDGGSGRVVARIALGAPLGTAAGGQDAAFSARHDEAYAAVGAGLARFDTRTNTLAGRIEVGGDAVAAVAYDDAADRLVLGRLATTDPLGAPGSVSVHDRSGAELARFAAGVGPASIAFRTE